MKADCAPSSIPRVRIMGVLNLTPDSFSDGGKLLDPAAAVAQGLSMIEDGATIIDLGAESSRPGSKGVAAIEQLQRLISVLTDLRAKTKIDLSVDTQSAEVAAACLTEGANIINDISALRHDAKMSSVLQKSGCGVILMHMQGTPENMQKNPVYGDVVGDITRFFHERLADCERNGIEPARVWLDPGIGFGKTFEHNLEIVRRFGEFASLGRPLVAGASRKSFLGRITGQQDPSKRDAASIAAGLLLAQSGASILRVHDVAGHVIALKVFESFHH